jgi:hypothetical protein
VPSNPPAYNPESNGVVEKGAQDVIAHLRCFKLALESRLETTIEAKHPIIEWLLIHVCFLLARFAVGHDGKTPWERLTGKTWRRPLVEFAEQVWGKLARQRLARHQGHKRTGIKRKLAARWLDGTWVGQDPRSGEHILVTPAGRAVRVRTVKRKPLGSRWATKTVLAINATPRHPNPRQNNPDMDAPTEDNPENMVEKRAEDHVPVEPERPRAMIPRDSDIRELRLTNRMFGKFGYSTDHGIDCKGCFHAQNGLYHRQHSYECRRRMY